MNKSTITNSTNQIQGTLFSLSSLQSKKVEAGFTSPGSSSFGGLLLMRECEKETGFIGAPVKTYLFAKRVGIAHAELCHITKSRLASSETKN